MGMKKDTCSFSGLPIHPGHGKRYVPSMVVSTKPVLPFVSAKARAMFLSKKNPRKISWTIADRRVNKNVVRAYSSMDADSIQKRRTEKPADRSAARAAALQELKERKSKAKSKK